MPLAKGRSPKTISKNISEFHKGPTYAHTLAKFGKKRANAQAVAAALNTARKYQAGGEVEEPSQDRLMKTAEGFPFVQAGETIQPPGSGLYNLGKQVVGGMQEHLAAPAPIKSNEGPPVYSTTPPATASPETGREILHELNPLRWFDQPPVKDLPSDAYKGKIEPNQPDWIAPVAAGLEAGSNLIGLPSLFGAGVSKAAIAFGAKMATSQAAKQAPKVAPAVASKIHQEMAGLPGFLDTSSFTQKGHQLGFHAGGVYTAPDGAQYYLKAGIDPDNVLNEQLGSKLYALAGTPVAEVNITAFNGKPGIASKFLPNAHQLSETKLAYKDIPGLHDNFVVDAWLANHDAVGTGGENPLGNIMISNGKAVRIDTGGSLRYKGSGDLKKHFYDEADEIDSMRSYDFSKRSADVFHDVSPEAMKAGAQKVADVDPKQLAKVIAEFGPSSPYAQQQLLNKLLKRREYIMEKLGVRPSWEKPAAPAVTADEPLDPLTAEAWAALEKELVGYNPEKPRGVARPEPEMVGEKDFSQGSLPPEPPPSKNGPYELLDDLAPAADETSRAVKAIQPDAKPIDKFKSTAAAQELKPSLAEALFKPGELDKKTAKQIIKDLAPSLNEVGGVSHWSGDEPAKVAAYIWQIAQHAGPHKAEAVFRALPETGAGTRQNNVGPILSAMKKDFGSSPWDDMTGTKYLIAKSISLKPNEFGGKNVSIAKEIIGKPDNKTTALSAVEQKKAKLLKSQEQAKKSYVADPKAEAKKIIAETGGDVYKIASKLYAKAHYNPILADDILKSILNTSTKYDNVTAELNALIDTRKYDPWAQKPGKLSTITQIASDMKKVDWQSYKPVHNDNLKPIEWGPVSKMIIKSLGFNTEFQLFHGKSSLPLETVKELGLPDKYYSSHSPVPLLKRYPTELMEPSSKKSHEQAFYLADRPEVAKSYGPNVLPFLARPKKAVKVDWNEINNGDPYYNGNLMGNVIEAGRSRGADMIIIENLKDQGHYGLQTQYLVLNTEILRGPKAKFDPAKLHLRMPLAGVAGGGLLAYGSLKGEDNKMRRGGSITTALRAAKKYASGGPGSAPWNVRNSSHIPHGPGMIQSSIPGRTDKLPLSVKSGSFILPADIPSALGEGNTMAGGKILSKMLESGPLGVKPLTPPRVKKTKFPSLGRFRKPKAKGFAEGGESEEVPIIAAGGEWIVDPEQVAGIGGGDLDKGHKVLKNFVLDVRRKNIKTLRKLKEPKMS